MPRIAGAIGLRPSGNAQGSYFFKPRLTQKNHLKQLDNFAHAIGSNKYFNINWRSQTKV